MKTEFCAIWFYQEIECVCAWQLVRQVEVLFARSRLFVIFMRRSVDNINTVNYNSTYI